MNLGNAIFAKLTAGPDLDPALAGLLGKRVYPELNPNNTFPHVVYSATCDTVDPLKGTARLQSFTVNLSIAAATSAQASQLAALVKAALNKQSGVWGGVTVKAFSFDASNDDGIAEVSHAERIYFLSEQTYKVFAY